MSKVAVVLFNLGGPDSRGAIKPFLMNFFMDKNIIGAPIPLRCFIAAYISGKRSKKEASDSYGLLGDKSPLLENSKAQAQALEGVLNGGAAGEIFKVFVSMRYWHPMAPQVVREVRDWGADQVVFLPLYPQFSTTTTWSSLENWKKAADIAGYHPPSSVVCCYPENSGFVEASVENIVSVYRQAQADGHEAPRVLFSAHGLPEKVIKGGDPYQWQCEQSARAMAEKVRGALSIEALDWQICYQSRVGPLKWIGPSVEEALEKAAADKKAVVIYPHAFTQEHVETLVELDIEYRHRAEELKLPGYYRAQTVGTHGAFIEGLAGLVRDHLGRQGICAEGGKRICPEAFGRCCMRSLNWVAQ
ncbi:MAG: ferrochelatase [Alphaproteobacteria bacterium]|nr:ferrochelatase [Alphaproteobacteria bacterium]MBP7758724.1 ferrochelatase [Alphaproteobacteria bacterium]MBP7761752.1 ferrochelatase [Alphaproteobacteria bacterium]MBP7903695.1 ferrochelatase [Alphaproteobacteria bacterium]